MHHMGKMSGRIGDMFESIGYRIEKRMNRYPAVERAARESRFPTVGIAGFLGIVIPLVFATQLNEYSYLIGTPFALAAIWNAFEAPNASTPARIFGRMLMTILLLALMGVALLIAQKVL
jgi:hypothetical protein